MYGCLGVHEYCGFPLKYGFIIVQVCIHMHTYTQSISKYAGQFDGETYMYPDSLPASPLKVHVPDDHVSRSPEQHCTELTTIKQGIIHDSSKLSH